MRQNCPLSGDTVHYHRQLWIRFCCLWYYSFELLSSTWSQYGVCGVIGCCVHDLVVVSLDVSLWYVRWQILTCACSANWEALATQLRMPLASWPACA